MPRPARRSPRGLILVAALVVGVVTASLVGSAAPERATEQATERATERAVEQDRTGARMSGVEGAVDTPGTGSTSGPLPDGGFSATSVANDTSPPLRDATPQDVPRGLRRGLDGEIEEGAVRKDLSPHPKGGAPDPVAQRAPAGPTTASATLGTSFDSVGNPLSTVRWHPPDPNSAVGATQVVTVVNTDLVVQSKSGTVLYGPVGTSTVWSGFSGACSTTNDGDAVVRYDRTAARWVITQFANVDSYSGPYYECVAVSTSSDFTGSWYRYAYTFTDFPDYPKLSVWGDSYVITYNMFSAAGSWIGPKVCGMQRAAMLVGSPAAQQCYSLGGRYGSPLAADDDGVTAPPAGAAIPVVALDDQSSTTLPSWTVKFDWTTPANSVFTGPTSIAVAAFTPACNGGNCIAQPGTTNVLDSLGDRLMFRLAYRNFGSYESMVVAHSVTTGGVIGVRWYELRRTSGGALSVFQQGTYVPDATSRWMPSIAQDKVGNIAVGYSMSSASLFPSLGMAGRLVGDASGALGQPEVRLVTGGAAQVGSGGGALSRWGDYSSMNVDPADGCTFWYTGEYLKAGQSTAWSTRVSSFTLPGCDGPITPEFALGMNPPSGSVSPGSAVSATVGSTVVQGAAQTVALSASGLPTGASASFAPASVTAGGSSTMTITTTGSTPAGTYPITVTGTGTSSVRTTSFSLVVAAADFSVSVNPSAVAVGRGTSTATSVATVAVGSPQTVRLSVVGLPAGVTASWSPTSVTAGASSTLTLRASATATIGNSTVTVRGVGPSGTRTTPLSLKVLAVNPVLNPGFETGLLTPWTKSGTASVVSTTPQAGAWSAMAGKVTRTSGDSKVSQTFTAPTGATQVSFWYRTVCPDSVVYDWTTATLTDTATNVTTTILAKTCPPDSTWRQVTWPLTAGRSYTLTLISHDDNYVADPTYTQFDSVVVG